MRLLDWEQRLEAFIRAESDLPFDEAQHHCGWFAADAVRAMTGVDLAKDWRGRQRTIAGALRALRRAGLRDHVDLAAQSLPEIAPSFAYRGDVMVVAAGKDMALGVLMGEYICFRGRDGLVLQNRMTAIRAFKVG